MAEKITQPWSVSSGTPVGPVSTNLNEVTIRHFGGDFVGIRIDGRQLPDAHPPERDRTYALPGSDVLVEVLFLGGNPSAGVFEFIVA